MFRRINNNILQILIIIAIIVKLAVIGYAFAIIYDPVDHELTDKNGFVFSVQQDGMYQINAYGRDTFFGFGLNYTLNNGSTNFFDMTTDYTWNVTKTTYQDGYNVSFKNITTNTDFYSNVTFTPSVTKITNHLRNKMPTKDLTNVSFWYIFSLKNGDVVSWDNKSFGITNSTNISLYGNPYLNNKTSKVKINGRVLFGYQDMLSTGWNITSVHIRNATDIGFNANLKIVGVVFTRGNRQVNKNGGELFADPVIDNAVTGKIVTIGINQTNSTNLNLGQNLNASNITVWTVNITSSSNRNLTTTRCGTNTSGLVGCWYMDETTGTLVQDFSGNNNNGTWSGSATSNTTNGKFNNGGLFRPVNLSYINAGTNKKLNFGNTSFSASIWFKLSDDGRINSLLSKGTLGDTYLGYDVLVRADLTNNINFRVGNGTHVNNIGNVGNLADNNWHNIVVLRNDTNVSKLYVDGISTGIFVNSSGNMTTTNNLTIGRRSASSQWYFNGTIDEVQIYNRSLSADEIWNNYIIRAEQLQAKSTTNNTWSAVWNSSANNSLAIPFANGESASALQFLVPENATIDDITVYNYTQNANFSVTSTITTGEDYFQYSETHAGGYQNITVGYIPSQTYNYTLININMTDYSDTYNGVTTLENTTSRTLGGTHPNHIVNFTAPLNNTLSFHNLSKTYNTVPVVSADDQSYKKGGIIDIIFSSSDNEGNTLNNSLNIINNIKYGNSPINFDGLNTGNYLTRLNVTDNNGTIGTQPYPYTNTSFWVNISNRQRIQVIISGN